MKKRHYDAKRYLFYDIHRVLGFWLFYLWYRPKYYYVNGKSTKEKIKPFYKKGGAMIISNHNAFADPVHVQMTFGFRHHNILSAGDVIISPFLKWLTPKLLSIFVDRENLSLKSFREIVRLLKDGYIIHCFSEGHITPDDQTFGEFKDGASVFSITSKTPIIPMYIPQRKNFLKRLIVCYNDPIDTTNYKKEDIPALTKLSRDKCLECIEYVNNRKNNKNK